MNYDWFLWRPVAAKYGTLTEVHEHWSIDDLFDAHEVLDVQAEAEAHQAERMKRAARPT